MTDDDGDEAGEPAAATDDGARRAEPADDEAAASGTDEEEPSLPDPAEASDAAFDAVADALEDRGRPVVTADDVARGLGVDEARARDLLDGLVDAGELARLGTVDPAAYYPADWDRVARRERVILFPEQRRIVAHHPEQFTRAQLAGFARLVDTTGAGAYMYEVREEDVWSAPHEEFAGLLRRVRDALDARHPEFEAWLEDQWRRARQFTLRTHEDGYVVLAADSASLMGNVAREQLPDDALRAPISDTESWVAEERTAEVKRVLYEAGYPVADDRDLETGDPLELTLNLELREYQRDWVERFEAANSGVLVGPPGSGKTVAAMGAMASVGGETLVLVPSRELAAQWRETLLANTSLSPEQVGEYHGGTKQRRPVTIATYQTAGMDRHRELFDSREWGLIVFDECLAGDSVVETPEGRTTFTQLDEDHDFSEGWNRDVDLSVLTFDPDDDEYRCTDVNGVYKTRKPVQRIETDTGKEIRATPNHTHLIFDPETGTIREQRGITEGDFLVQPTPSIRVERASPDSLSREAALAELLGWALGDGHVSARDDLKFSFARRAERQIEIVESLCDRLGQPASVFENGRGDLSLFASDGGERLGISHLSGDKTDTVHVPPEAYAWESGRIAALLRGLFDAEGSVDRKGRIQFNSVSESLADDVQCLLQKLGFPTRRIEIERDGDDHSDVHRLLVPSAFGERFGEVVGFRLEHKSARLTDGASPATGLPVGPLLASIKADVGLTNDDLAGMMDLARSTVGEVIRDECRLGQANLRQLGESLRSFAETTPSEVEELRSRHHVTYHQLGDEVDLSTGGAYRHVQRETETARAGLESIGEQARSAAARYAEDLLRLSGLNITEVTAVETLDEEAVYDFETESHTFVADGFLTHNCHHIPSPVFRRSAELQSKHRLGLSATPVRGDDREEDIFTLIGPPVGTDWDALFEAGFVAEPEVEIRYLPWGDDDARNEFAAAESHERRQVAAANPAKVEETRRLLAEHEGQNALVFVDYIDQGEAMAEALGVPFVSGETPHPRRRALLGEFERGDRDVLVVSRVGDEGIDLPNAEVAVLASGLGGSRRQGAQRAGRTMRPAGGAHVYVLATAGTREEEFARNRTRHLAEKGVRVTETRIEDRAPGPDDADDDGGGLGDDGDPATDAGELDSPASED